MSFATAPTPSMRVQLLLEPCTEEGEAMPPGLYLVAKSYGRTALVHLDLFGDTPIESVAADALGKSVARRLAEAQRLALEAFGQ